MWAKAVGSGNPSNIAELQEKVEEFQDQEDQGQLAEGQEHPVADHEEGILVTLQDTAKRPKKHTGVEEQKADGLVTQKGTVKHLKKHTGVEENQVAGLVTHKDIHKLQEKVGDQQQDQEEHAAGPDQQVEEALAAEAEEDATY